MSLKSARSLPFFELAMELLDVQNSAGGCRIKKRVGYGKKLQAMVASFMLVLVGLVVRAFFSSIFGRFISFFFWNDA